MPAFTGSLHEKDRWLIASFVKRLAGMSAKDYQSLSPAGGRLAGFQWLLANEPATQTVGKSPGKSSTSGSADRHKP